jgi:hypothetical protein
MKTPTQRLGPAFAPDVSLTEITLGMWQPSTVHDIPKVVCIIGGISAYVSGIDAFIQAAGQKGLTVETIPLQ